MRLELTFYGLSSLTLGTIGLFAALALALSGPREGRPGLLSLFVAGLSLPMLMGFIDEAGWADHPLGFYPPLIGAFLTGPALYLYALSPWRSRLEGADALHAVPVVVGTALAIYLGRVAEQQAPDAFLLWAAALYLSNGAYAAMTLRLLRRYHAALETRYSDTYRRRLTWLRLAAGGLLALIAVDVVFGVLLGSQAASAEAARLTLTLLLSLMVFVLSLSALRNPARYLSELADAGPEEAARYATSALPAALLADWRGRLEQAMSERQLFLRNDLSLGDLADELGLSPHKVSQLLNQEIGMTFYAFVNRARVDYACELLRTTERSVLDVAFASGFNNKASFYTAFRQHTGTTPSEYRAAGARRLAPSSPA